ncbi:MAG: sulfatase-like hydrolase/transferase, partial [Anaerolineaceae bacterium]|nr:sulfatase-like hydrolase/transferase [Anaerolineaceae bacterium]
MISIMRLAIAAVFWVLFTIGIFALLHFDVLKTHGIKPKLLMTSLIIGLLFSSLFLWLTFDLQELPYNLLLLPKQNLKISFMCSEDGDQTAELKYFHNGLSIISYSAFQKEGNWDRTQDSLRAIDCSGASLSYYGWLVEQPYIVFRTQPDSGELELRWNGISQTADLNSPEISELKFNQDFGYEPLNKISVFITFAIAFAAIIFPLALMIAKDILHEDATFSLGQWFNETGERFLQLIGVVIIFTCFTTVILFLTPLFAKDRTPVQIKQPEPNQYPNIILILVDSLAAQDMSISGYALQTTPHLDRIMKDWTVYTNANTISTCTIRIFPSLVTGRYPDFAYPLSRFGQLISTSS